MAEAAGGERRSRRWLRILAYTLAVAAWLFFSIPPRDNDDTAYWLGQITGSALVALAIPFVIRAVYWQVKDRKPAFWTPWIFVLAAVLALFVRVSMRMSEDTARKDKAATLVAARTSGPKSADVKECVTGALEAYDTNYRVRDRIRNELRITKKQYTSLSVQYCQELERRDLLADEPTQESAQRAMAAVVSSMRERGELPPG